jgi:hypothetical protein
MEEAGEEAKGGGSGVTARACSSGMWRDDTGRVKPDPACAVFRAFLVFLWGIVWGITSITKAKGLKDFL